MSHLPGHLQFSRHPCHCLAAAHCPLDPLVSCPLDRVEMETLDQFRPIFSARRVSCLFLVRTMSQLQQPAGSNRCSNSNSSSNKKELIQHMLH